MSEDDENGKKKSKIKKVKSKVKKSEKPEVTKTEPEA